MRKQKTRRALLLLCSIFLLAQQTPPAPTAPGFVCERDVRAKLDASPFAKLPSVEEQLASTCTKETGISWKSLLDAALKGQDALKQLLERASKNASCNAWIHHRVGNFCVKDLQSRMNSCGLYANPEIQKISEKTLDDIEKKQGAVDWSNARIQAIGQRLLQANTQHCFPGTFRFGVIPGKNNAFALPDGSVVVEDDYLHASDARLAFVLSHEIMHIEWVSFQGPLNILGWNTTSGWKGALQALKATAYDICRGPMEEMFVDLNGVQLITAAGYDPSEAAETLRQFPPGKNADLRISHSHPPLPMRIQNAEQGARIALAQQRWPHPFFFRGSAPSAALPQPQWDGTRPPAAFENTCQQPP